MPAAPGKRAGDGARLSLVAGDLVDRPVKALLLARGYGGMTRRLRSREGASQEVTHGAAKLVHGKGLAEHTLCAALPELPLEPLAGESAHDEHGEGGGWRPARA